MEIEQIIMSCRKWTPRPLPPGPIKVNSVTVTYIASKFLSQRSNGGTKYKIVESHKATEYVEFPVRIYRGIGDLVTTIKTRFSSLDALKAANKAMYTEVIKDLDAIRAKKKSTPSYYVVPNNTQPVFVYTDIVEPQLVGDSYVRCLRVVQFPAADGHHIFTDKYYVPVEKTSFNAVAVELLTSLGITQCLPAV